MHEKSDEPDTASGMAGRLLALTTDARERVRDDPFGNPVLAVSLAISRMLDECVLDEVQVSDLVRHLRDAAYADRAIRLARYVGGTDPASTAAAMDTLGQAAGLPRPRGQPGALGDVPPEGGTRLFRRGIHRSPNLLDAPFGG